MNATAADTACLSSWAIAGTVVGVTAGAIAGIIIAIVVAVVIVVAVSTAGTYELVKRADMFKKQGTVENPLYESSANEGHNPLFDTQAEPTPKEKPVELPEVSGAPTP